MSESVRVGHAIFRHLMEEAAHDTKYIRQPASMLSGVFKVYPFSGKSASASRGVLLKWFTEN